MKIAVYAIAKDEEGFVQRFCESAKDADLILIADTGSTDRTKEIAQEYGATVVDICITPWRFDKARDAALALVPGDFDVCVSLDLDEVLTEGWREEIEGVWNEDTTRLRYKYDWGRGVSFYYEKIHHRHGYHWHHPCHEYPRCDARLEEMYAFTDKLLVVHKPDPTKSRGQYLDLLELSVKEDPHCPRNAFYYARELTFYAKWEEAIVELERYLELPGANWNYERCYAMRLLGKCYNQLGRTDDAIEWLEEACKTAPDTREPFVELAEVYYGLGDWEAMYTNLRTALSIKEKLDIYMADPSVWGARPHDLFALACFYTGWYEEALQHGDIACKLNPSDTRLSDNMKFYEAKAA